MMVKTKDEVYWSRKRYRLENKDKLRQKNREYREKNREKVRKWNKEQKLKNPEKTKEYMRKRNTGLRRERKEEAIESRGSKCVICGYIYNGFNFSAFDFHHINPTEKERPINFLRNDYIMELSKCQLVCSNCHRIIHQEDRCLTVEKQS